MALTQDELVAISDLTGAVINDTTIVPDWVLPGEVRGSAAPINSIPYPQQTIDVFGGLLAGTWSLKFQNPLQRIVCDLEIFHGDNAPVNTPPDLSALQLTVAGFDKAVIFCPAKTATDTAPANYFGLNVSGVTPVYKLGGKRRFLEQSGLVVIPLTMILLSTRALTSQEASRALSITLKRKNETQMITAPIISGMVYSNPLPSARDIAQAS
ncbi:TPA: hypothetical protein MYQ04_004238 [Citrobacter braakii]|uniref:Uncharacterized protein n=1 Tax=Escherichia coli TaxID=562 RepID=A0A7U5TH53_ECOLX|nr:MULTISPECIES: hypothetical protein [Enterobacteriaceae]AUY01018.1 hypothetical protein C3F40_03815 [Escherichia coli]HCB1742879.1 hypothetical protein [Citrobacter braakii]HEE0093325.1 hypothetical protein [Citrobacter braakii]HEE9916478.1 hypothetical protein [Citrobacter braakii]